MVCFGCALIEIYHVITLLTFHWLGPQPYNRYVTISTITNAITIQMWHLIPYLLAWERNITSQSNCTIMVTEHLAVYNAKTYIHRCLDV